MSLKPKKARITKGHSAWGYDERGGISVYIGSGSVFVFDDIGVSVQHFWIRAPGQLWNTIHQVRGG